MPYHLIISLEFHLLLEGPQRGSDGKMTPMWWWDQRASQWTELMALLEARQWCQLLSVQNVKLVIKYELNWCSNNYQPKIYRWAKNNVYSLMACLYQKHRIVAFNSTEETDKCQDILDWIIYLLRWKSITAFSQYCQYYCSHICY